MAAPLRRLSLTHQKSKVFGLLEVLADSADEDVVLAGGRGGQWILAARGIVDDGHAG